MWSKLRLGNRMGTIWPFKFQTELISKHFSCSICIIKAQFSGKIDGDLSCSYAAVVMQNDNGNNFSHNYSNQLYTTTALITECLDQVQINFPIRPHSNYASGTWNVLGNESLVECSNWAHPIGEAVGFQAAYIPILLFDTGSCPTHQIGSVLTPP